MAGERGTCRIGPEVVVASVQSHFGEERPLVGSRGSGTIFFASCNLRCVFCQNAAISHSAAGTAVDARRLAEIFSAIQQAGCHNINLVTPTHVIAGIVKALAVAAASSSSAAEARGRRAPVSLPIVYNCGGYESVETLRLLDGIVDIYMPDLKYSNDKTAKLLSGVDDYWEHATLGVKEMHRQVGDLVLEASGIAVRGLIVRHLVMPNRVAGSERVLDFIASEISSDTYVNLMDQYHPAYHASRFPEIARRVTWGEYLQVLEHAMNVGLHRGLHEP